MNVFAKLFRRPALRGDARGYLLEEERTIAPRRGGAPATLTATARLRRPQLVVVNVPPVAQQKLLTIFGRRR